MYNILQYQKWWGFLEYFIYSSVVKVSVMRRHNTGSSIKLGAFFMSFQNVCQATQRKTLKACEKHRRAIAQEYFNN